MKIQTLPLYQKGHFALAIIALTVLIFYLRNEPALTYDSHDYIDASEGTVTYFLGENDDGFRYTLRPPLYPLYLSFFTDKITAAWWLNVVCFFFSLWMIVLIADYLKWSVIWTYASVLLTAVSLPWLENHFFVWTEPVFSAVFLLLIYFLLKKKSVAVILVTCLILFSIRKAGLFILIITCFYYLLDKQYRNFFVFGIIAGVFVVGWEILVTSFAERSPFISNFEYLSHLDRAAFLDVITAWILPRKIPVLFRVILIVVSLTSIVIFFREQFRAFLNETHNKILLIYLIGYSLFFVVIVGSTGFHETERYISVVMPLFILILVSFAAGMRNENIPERRILYLLFAIWTLYPLIRSIKYLTTM